MTKKISIKTARSECRTECCREMINDFDKKIFKITRVQVEGIFPKIFDQCQWGNSQNFVVYCIAYFLK